MTLAEKYQNAINDKKSKVVIVSKFVCYPIQGTSASLIIFEDLSSATEVGGRVIHTDCPDENYRHHFEKIDVDL